jgi:hypothetical protein
MQVNEDSSLELCGLIVDVIECVTSSAGKGLSVLESYPWLSECLEIIKNTANGAQDTYPTSAATHTIPTTFADGSPIPEQRQEYTRAEQVLDSVLYPPGTLFGDSPRTILQCNGHKFFRTKTGRFGIGPADVEENDILCSMYGARTLWALRPLIPSEKGRGQQVSTFSGQSTGDQDFKLLGSAYTPSLLKGEAWIGTRCVSMQRFKLR